MGRNASKALASALLWACVLSCRTPTEVTVAISTDFACTDLRGTILKSGVLHVIESAPTALVTSACENAFPNAKVGTVVLVPSGSQTASFAFKVVAGFGRNVEDCLQKFGPGCIVSRRALGYVPHTPLLVPVVLTRDCNGVACGETETCAHGACVPAQIDPHSCEAPGGCEPDAPDASAPDATTDANADAPVGPPSDGASLDSTADSPIQTSATYHDVTNPAYWSSFDITSVESMSRFEGAAFDGRYLYFAPSNAGNAVVPRYDTQAPFASSTSWSTFNANAAGAYGSHGAVFDGRYVSLVPFTGRAVRYDTQAPFGAPSAWVGFAPSTINANATAFAGAVSDGRFVYYLPDGSGIVAAHQISGDFTNGATWATFNLTTLNAGATTFTGGMFDGKYVYLVPRNSGLADGLFVRYDPSQAFTSGASWVTFPVAPLMGSEQFRRGAFDGRYAYFIGEASHIAQYDTRAPFNALSSWVIFDVQTADPNFGTCSGASFDGRYLYFITYAKSLIGRYDTQAPFAASTSWVTFDIAAINANVAGSDSTAFDGRYVYVVPSDGRIVTRFDAKTPSSMPAGYSGSFY